MSDNFNTRQNSPEVYQAPTNIEGYIKGYKVRRPLAFKQYFGDVGTTFSEVVSLDIEANEQNIMGQYADPDANVVRIQLPGIGMADLAFGYTKEFAGSPDYSEISQRMLMESPNNMQLSQQRFARAYAENMQKQMSKAYERIENLYELARANTLITGRHTTVGLDGRGKHKEVTWDMGRTRLTNGGANTQATRDLNFQSVMGANNDLVPEVDLTRLWANTTTAVGGGLSWDGLDANPATPVAIVADQPVSPVSQLNRMLIIAGERAGTEAIFMSQDAYSWFRRDLVTNFADLSNTFMLTNVTLVQQLLPMVQQQEGLTLAMVYPGPQGPIPIYIYTGTYIDRDTGLKRRYFPLGHVVLVPPAQYGGMRFGKIKHIKAMWNAQQFWVNVWKDEKSGSENWELHSNFAVYHTDINSVVSWRVCSTAFRGQFA